MARAAKTSEPLERYCPVRKDNLNKEDTTMEIRDYESGRQLSDVNLVLSREEAAELQTYLARLLDNPDLRRVYLSEVSGMCFEKELSISLDGSPAASA